MQSIKNYFIKPKNQKIFYIPVPTCNAKNAAKVEGTLAKMTKANTAALFVGINSGTKDSIVQAELIGQML